MKKKNINKSLYKSIMTDISKVIKELLLLNKITYKPVLCESIFTDDDYDLLSNDESVLDKYLGGRYKGIKDLINEPDKDRIFKFGTILFVKGGFNHLCINNNIEIIADNFNDTIFDADELSNIIKKHKIEGRLPFAFCFGKNDDGKYVFSLPGDGSDIYFCEPYVLNYLYDKAKHFSWDVYDDNIMSIGEMIEDSHGKITGKLILQNGYQLYNNNLLFKIYKCKDMFNNKLNIDAPDSYVLDLLHKMYSNQKAFGIISDILNVYNFDGIWTTYIDIYGGHGDCYDIYDEEFYLLEADKASWFLTFTL